MPDSMTWEGELFRSAHDRVSDKRQTWRKTEEKEHHGMKRLTFQIQGMTCDHCALTAEKTLRKTPCVSSAGVSYSGGAERPRSKTMSPSGGSKKLSARPDTG